MLIRATGATTAIFSVVNGVLIKPLPYPNPDELVRIVHSIGGTDQPYFSDGIYLNYVDNTQAFQDMGVWSPGETATITGLGDPEEIRTLTASRGVLTTLGVQPEIGRWFSATEDTSGALDMVLLTYDYWRRRFGGDRGVLERTLTINGRPHQITGVMPAEFRFSREFEIILPLRMDRGAPIASFRLLGVARMKPSVTLAQANADAGRILDIWFHRPGGNPAVRARWAPALIPLKQDVVGDVGRTLWILFGAIGVVLLLACANIANLLLVRADARRQEFAIRAALGARWSRMARQLLVESLTLALLGGAIGVGLAYGGVRALIAIGPSNLPRLAEISVDPVVLGFALTISLASGREVVGVARDVYDDGVHQPAPATIYWPTQPDERLLGMSGFQARRVSFAIRSERAGTQHLLSQVQEAVWSVSATLPLAQVRTLNEVYRQSMSRTSFTLVMLAIAGTMALLLGISGIYGVISYAVSLRRREIGIRLALGANTHQLKRLFVWRGLTLAVIGMVIGLAVAAGLTQLMRSLLFGISPLDPMTLAIAPVLLALAAALACYVPARRAMEVDPAETLRAE